jgi:hypothetical protein
MTVTVFDPEQEIRKQTMFSIDVLKKFPFFRIRSEKYIESEEPVRPTWLELMIFDNFGINVFIKPRKDEPGTCDVEAMDITVSDISKLTDLAIAKPTSDRWILTASIEM